jgi:hypothetical protein
LRARARRAARARRRFFDGDDRVLGCMVAKHPVRAAAIRIVAHRHFESAILALILLSSLALAIDAPGRDEAAWRLRATPALTALDWLFTVLFLLEMLLKMLAFGVARAPGAYLKNGWNCLDAFLVAASVASRVADTVEVYTGARAGASVRALNALRTVRLLRVLRPLRALTQHDGLKLVVNSLLRSLPEVLNVLTIFALLLQSSPSSASSSSRASSRRATTRRS